MRVATSAAVNGPRLPKRASASSATEVSRAYQPVSTSRTDAPTASFVHPSAIISWSTRT